VALHSSIVILATENGSSGFARGSMAQRRSST
jgi:hypothetical protein